MKDASPAQIQRLHDSDLYRFASEQKAGSETALAAASAIKRREAETPWLPIILSLLSLLVSIILSVRQFNLGDRQFKLASEMPYKAALYSARVQALRDYSRSFSELDGVLHQGMLELKLYPGDPYPLKKRSDQQLDAQLPAARRVMAGYLKYNSETIGSQAVWPNALIDKINASQEAAMASVQCFTIIGVHEDGSHQDWDMVRSEVTTQCADARFNTQKFEDASVETMKAMRDILKSD